MRGATYSRRVIATPADVSALLRERAVSCRASAPRDDNSPEAAALRGKAKAFDEAADQVDRIERRDADKMDLRQHWRPQGDDRLVPKVGLSRKDAEAIAAKFGERVNAYLCGICGHYHTGRGKPRLEQR